jgi:hypothetical protein
MEAIFDAARQISLKIQSAEGIKAITVRFPTDEEWIERQRRRKVIIKQLGRGVSETIVPDSEDVDAELLVKLRGEEEGPEIDAFEASRALDQLAQADVDDVVQQDGGAFRITLRVPGAITTHILRMPSAKEIIQYRRAFTRLLDLHYNKQQLLINLGAAGDLYKKISQESSGYAGAIPIIHQAAAVKAAIDELESGLGVAGSENF